jgi:hypothetical protein
MKRREFFQRGWSRIGCLRVSGRARTECVAGDDKLKGFKLVQNQV